MTGLKKTRKGWLAGLVLPVALIAGGMGMVSVPSQEAAAATTTQYYALLFSYYGNEHAAAAYNTLRTTNSYNTYYCAYYALYYAYAGYNGSGLVNFDYASQYSYYGYYYGDLSFKANRNNVDAREALTYELYTAYFAGYAADGF